MFHHIITHRVLLALGIVSAVVVGTVTLTFTSALASTGAPANTIGMCSQASVVSAERDVPLLDPHEARIAIPTGEPKIVAQVDGKAITAQQLEMLVSLLERNHREFLAGNPLSSLPPAMKAVMAESPAQMRQSALTTLIERQLWLADGQTHDLYASPAQASSAAAHFEATAQSSVAIGDSRIQFQAYLCVNNLSATSFATDPRVIHSFQESLTITAAKSAVASSLTPAQQKDQATVNAALAAHMHALWAAGNVHVFLAGFVPTA